MKKKKKSAKDKYNVSFDETYINPHNIASSTDCTGLVQTPPQSEEEAESYAELYDIHKQHKNSPDKIPK